MLEIQRMILGIWLALVSSALLVGVSDRVLAVTKEPGGVSLGQLTISLLVTVGLLFLCPIRR